MVSSQNINDPKIGHTWRDFHKVPDEQAEI